MKYREMTAEQRKAEFEKVSAEFEAWKAKGLKLNMARGRPGKEQLDLVSDILSVMTDPADCVDGDVNVRNYGQLSGLPSAKALFAEILGCKPEQVFVGGNASLLNCCLDCVNCIVGICSELVRLDAVSCYISLGECLTALLSGGERG